MKSWVSLIWTHNGGTANPVTSGVILVLISSGPPGRRRRESPLPPPMRQSQPLTRDASMELVAGQDSNVMFFRLAEIG